MISVLSPSSKILFIKSATYLCLVYKCGLLSYTRRASFVLFIDPVESLILFKEKIGVKALNIKSGTSTQDENKQIHPIVSVGDLRMCPECRAIGCVVWVSKDKKRMGVQCRKSHAETNRPLFKYGTTVASSAKTRKNSVFLTAVT
jgi:hypothetical protein